MFLQTVVVFFFFFFFFFQVYSFEFFWETCPDIVLTLHFNTSKYNKSVVLFLPGQTLRRKQSPKESTIKTLRVRNSNQIDCL